MTTTTTTTAPPRNGQLPPVDPPQGPRAPGPPVGRSRWYRRGWVIALGALLVGVGLGSAAGSSKNTPRAATVTTPAQTIVQAVPGRTRTRTVVRIRKVPGPTTTVTVQASTSAPAPAASAPGSSGGGGQVYTGNGNKNFGTIVVNADSTLHWTCQCDPASGFYLSSSADPNSLNTIDIQQSGSSGTTAVGTGTYANVQSIGNGQFSFYLSPG